MWGAMINHSRHNANVKPFVIDKNSDNPCAFFVALHDVAETTELLWDYNDPDWMYYSSSQFNMQLSATRVKVWCAFGIVKG